MTNAEKKEKATNESPNTIKESFTQLLHEAEIKGYDLKPLLYCINYRVFPEYLTESLRIVYMELAEYILQYLCYSGQEDMSHHLNRIRCLYEAMKEVRFDPEEL